MDFLTEVLGAEAGFVFAAGRCPVEIVTHKREDRRHGEGFRGKQDLAACVTAYTRSGLEIGAQAGGIEEEGWCGEVIFGQ